MKTVNANVSKQTGKQRRGRGFSRNELKEASTNIKEALKLHVPVDSRRKSAHEDNVKALKAFLQANKPARKPKAKPKS